MNAVVSERRMEWHLRPKALPIFMRVRRAQATTTSLAPQGANADAHPPDGDGVEARFQALAARWQEETRLISSLPQITAHPAYQDIIRMGHPVVPFILREMEKRPNHWGAALQAITGAQPVPKEHAGRVKAITADWLTWAKENGYVW